MVDNSQRIEGAPHFEVKITDKNLQKVVTTLISHVKKDWDLGKLQCKVFEDGISNKLFGYYVSTNHLKSRSNGDSNIEEHTTENGVYDMGRSDIILVRIYGNKSELIIDRARELRNFQLLLRSGLSPPIYNTFENGFCYGYVEGRVLTPTDGTDPIIWPKIAKLMAKLHTLKLDESYLFHHKLESTIFDTVQRFLKLAPKMFPDPKQHARFEKEVPSMDQLRLELKELKAILGNCNSEVAFCHNDLLFGNFIYNEMSEKLNIIDYEYGCPNYTTFDIANHFNEFAGIDPVDFGNCPNKEYQMKWLRTYLEEREALKWNFDPVISEEKLEALYVEVNQFSLLSHLFWGVWALIQAYYSEIDFDFLGYGIMRLNEYFRLKPERLALSSK